MMQHCTRCGGQTINHYGEVKCLQCGHDQQPKITTTEGTVLEIEPPQQTDAKLWRIEKEKTSIFPLTTPEDITNWKKNK